MLTTLSILGLIGAFFYLLLDNSKLRLEVKNNKELQNRANLSLSDRINDLDKKAQVDRKGTAELARLLGQDVRNLHNIAAAASEEIDNLKGASAQNANNLSDQVISLSKRLGLLDLAVSDLERKKSEKKSKKSLKRSKK
jgi:hypothetical protein